MREKRQKKKITQMRRVNRDSQSKEKGQGQGEKKREREEL